VEVEIEVEVKGRHYVVGKGCPKGVSSQALPDEVSISLEVSVRNIAKISAFVLPLVSFTKIRQKIKAYEKPANCTQRLKIM